MGPTPLDADLSRASWIGTAHVGLSPNSPRGLSMSFGRYRLLSQLGAGRDGVRYRASDRHDGTIVEMVLLGDARADPDRWSEIERRLRMALMIAHPSARRVLGLDFEDDPPYVALEWVDGPTFSESGRE